MKINKSSIKGLVFVLICAMITGTFGFGAIPAEASTVTLVDIDSAMTLVTNTSGNRNLSQNGLVEHINYNGGFTAALAENNTQFVVSQTKSTAWNQRLMVKTPTSYLMTSPTVFEAKFKVKADDYTSNPEAKFIFNAGTLGAYLQMGSTVPLSATTQDTWQTIKYTMDPSTKKITGELNGTAVTTASFGATAPTDAFSGFGLYPVAQNTGKSADGEALTTPITWTFDSIKVTQEGSTTPGDTTLQELLSINSAMQLSNNTSGNRNLTQKGTIEHINWVGGFTATLAENNTQFVVNQTKSSAWNQRLMVRNPSAIELAAPTVFEIQFKVKADDYTKNPEAKFIFNAGDLGVYLQMGSTIPLSATAQDTLQTMKYTIDPVTRKITGELNGTVVTTSSFGATAPTSAFTGFGVYPVAQNAGRSADGDVLNTPITWTFQSFKVTYGNDTSPGSSPTPSATPAPQQPLKIDNAMQLTNNNLKEDGTIEYLNYNNAGTTTSLAENNTQFVVNQTLSTLWTQRLMVRNPSIFTLGAPIVFEAKFKIKADSYTGTMPQAKFMLYTNKLGGLTEMPAGTVPLTAAMQDNWQIVKYTIDPSTKTIVGELDGKIVVSSSFATSTLTGTFPDLGLFLTVQNPGSITEKEALPTPVTWTFDYFKLNEISGLSPLASPVIAAPWQSIAYPNGTGRDDAKALAEYVVPLGTLADVNKITIDHDTSKIMSFTIYTSKDGLSYTPVTDTYSGGLDKYSGQQTYRFAAVKAKYVKYRAVLLGDAYDTQAKLNNMVISFTDTQTLKFEDIPSIINPVDTKEVILRTSAIDVDADEYPLTRQGVTYTLGGTVPTGVTINGNVLSLDGVTTAGTINVVATDATNDVSISKEIAITPQVSVRNFALYADEGCTTPISALTAGLNIYAKAEVLANSAVADKSVGLMLCAYDTINGVEKLTKIYAPAMQAAPTSGDYMSITAPMTLPAGITGNSRVSALLWNINKMSPLAPSITYSPSGNATGLSAQNIFLDKSDKMTLKASASGGAILWESTNNKVATVDSSGVVTGMGEGKVMVTAKSGGVVIGSTAVEVKPSLYVYLFMGQSNMSGTNTPSNEGISVPISSNVKLLNKQGVFEQAQHPYRRHSGVNGIGTAMPYIGWSDASDTVNVNGGINMGYKFSEILAAKYPDTDIGLVVNSSSGSTILSYERNAEQLVAAANGFVNSVARVKQATAGRGEFKGIIWHQGESDQTDPTYAARQRNLIYDLRKELDAPEVPFIAGGLSEDNRSTSIVNTAVEANQQKVANFGFASSTLPTMIVSRARLGTTIYPGCETDYTHFSVAGQIMFGQRYYDKYVEVINKAKR